MATPSNSTSELVMKWISFLVVNGLLALAGYRTINQGEPFDKTLGFIILAITGASLGAFSLKYVINKIKP